MTVRKKKNTYASRASFMIVAGSSGRVDWRKENWFRKLPSCNVETWMADCYHGREAAKNEYRV